MSFSVKIACALMLATSAFAESSAFTDKPLPAMATVNAVAAASVAIPVTEMPENNRSVALAIGIAAVAVTFYRVIFRGRQVA
jgi:hypothetical protein